MPVVNFTPRLALRTDAPPDGDKAAADVPASATQSPGIMTPPSMVPTPPEDLRKKKKKADKVRSAWIAFVGRILAQVIGAAASVIFGILILQKYQASSRESKATPAATHPAGVRARRSQGETAIAVLPLANFSGDARQDYFADGLTEALTASLAQIKSMRVISRTSSMAYKGGQKPLPEIARELDVDLLVEGSVVRDGDRVRVTAQLIDGATDEHLWARSFDGTMKNVIGLQDDIARAIAAEVGTARPAAPSKT
jgi:TolB-like protein